MTIKLENTTFARFNVASGILPVYNLNIDTETDHFVGWADTDNEVSVHLFSETFCNPIFLTHHFKQDIHMFDTIWNHVE